MVLGGVLSIINRNELMIKTDFELTKIIKKENLLNKYAIYSQKDVLIENILLYMNRKYKYTIFKLSNEKKTILSKYIIESSIEQLYNENDIIFNEEFFIYLDIDNVTNKVYISVDKHISSNLIILLNIENEIYATGYLEYVTSNREYIEYIIHIPKCNNFIKEKIYDKLKIIFFEENSDIRVLNLYKGNNVNDLIHESLYVYTVYIDRYKIVKPNILDRLYIYLKDEKLISKYKEEIFSILFIDYFNDSIIYGEDVNEYLINDSFRYRDYEVLDLEYVLNNFDKEIECVDIQSNTFVLKGEDIFKLFVNNYISKIEANNLIRIKDIEYISNYHFKKILECQYDKYFCTNLKYIDINKKNNNYTLFYIDDSEFSILDVNYRVRDSKVSYEVDVNIEKKYVSDLFNIKNIKKYLIYVIKFLVLENPLKEIFYMDMLKFEDKLKSLEDIYPIMYNEYIYDKVLYSKSMQNYRKFEYISNYVWEIYINDIHEQFINLENLYDFGDFNILNGKFITRESVDYIVKQLFKVHIDNFFKNYDTIDIIKKFINIKISGELLKTKVVYDYLKEYVPGRYINNNINNNKEDLFYFLYKYDELKSRGEIKFIYNFNDIKYTFNLYSLNYKMEKYEIMKSNINKYGYIDRISETEYIDFILEYEYEYMDKNIKNIKWNLLKEYIEMDENDFLNMIDIGIEKNYINEVVEGKIRIFIYTDDYKLKFYQIKRINDQMYINSSEILI